MSAPAGSARPRYKGWAGIRRAFGTPSALTLALLSVWATRALTAPLKRLAGG